MSTAQEQQNQAAEPTKTAAEYTVEIERYDLALQAPNLDLILEARIKEQRVYAVRQKFLAELTTDHPAVVSPQEFIQPKVPDVMPVAVAENLKMWDLKIAEVEAFLKNAPPHHLIPGAETLLVEHKESRARVLHDFQNPTPIPVSPPPPPIQLPPEVVELVQKIVRAEVPSIVAEVVAFFKNNREWLQP